MHRFTRRGYVCSLAWLSGTSAAALLVGGAMMVAPAASPALPGSDGGLHQLDPNLTYLGNGGCTGAGCHSGEAKTHSGRKIGDENTIWSEKDPHAKAFKNLTNDKGKKIAGAMKIADASKDAKCTVCHATDAAKKGPKFAKDLGKEGVSCESCHGAAEKWNDPHQKEGWTDGQRKTPGALAALGMIDTFDLSIRAKMCVGCHLEIDKDMLAAGHPPLDFEMYSYNNYKFNDKWQPHWDEHGGPGRKAQMWAIGQVAASDSAKGGKVDANLAKLFDEGRGIVKDKFGTDDMAALAKAEPAKDKIKAALDALVAAAPAHKGEKHHREVITSGVDALVSATSDKDLGDPYINAIEAAGKAEGDAWVEGPQEGRGVREVTAQYK